MIQGFTNFANNCYFNSVIQALLSLDIFQKCLTTSYNPILSQLRECIKQRSVSLLKVLAKIPWYTIGSQECAHETLTRLIDYCMLSEYFRIKYKRRKECSQCGVTDLPEDDIISIIMHDSNELREDNVSVIKNKVDQCECGKPFTLYYIIKTLRNVIIVSFNKFQNKRDISYPLELVFQNKSGQDLIYDLKAQIEHIGNQKGGHYIAKVKRGSSWYLINDASVYPLAGIDQNPNAFIVIYEIRS